MRVVRVRGTTVALADDGGWRSQQEARVATDTQTYNGYCVKCREKRDFEGTVNVTDSGRRMAKGKCPVCGTTMNRILGKA